MNRSDRLELMMLRVAAITRHEEKKTQVELALKTAEEVGELAQAVLSHNKVPGNRYKKLGPDQIYEESADAFLCVLATMFKLHEGSDASDEDMLDYFLGRVDAKIEKWQWALKQEGR